MNKQEFNALYKQARVHTAIIGLKSQKDVRKAYIKASEYAASLIADAKLRGLSAITLSYWQGVQAELQTALLELSKSIEATTVESVTKSSKVYSNITKEYLLSTAISERITRDGIVRLSDRMNNRIVSNIINRFGSDGYTLSGRVWRNVNYYQKDIGEIVIRGTALGRDPVKIAKDIQVYTADGKIALAQRWANIEGSTQEWTKRIPGKVDWRAVRLVRSEQQMAIQAAGVQSGINNPATTGEYQWVLGPGSAPCDVCSEYAQHTYTAENIPAYPHPACLCTIVPILRNKDDFINDLERFSQGESVDYIDQWYYSSYL